MKKNIFFALILSLVTCEAFCMNSSWPNTHENQDINLKNEYRKAKTKGKKEIADFTKLSDISCNLFGTPTNSPINITTFFDNLQGDLFEEPRVKKSREEIYKDNLNKILAYYIYRYIYAYKAYGNIPESYCIEMAKCREFARAIDEGTDPEDINWDAERIKADINWYKNYIEDYRKMIIKCLKTKGTDVNKAAKLPKILEHCVDNNDPQFPLERVIKLHGPVSLIMLLRRYGADKCSDDWYDK